MYIGPTIGLDVSSKSVDLGEEGTVKLALWDSA